MHYPALRERASKRPWSIRQMAAYQSYDLVTRTSKWMFIQPCRVLERRLDTVLETDWVLDNTPTIPHLIFLQSAEKYWEEFLKYWKQQYEEMARLDLFFKKNRLRNLVIEKQGSVRDCGSNGHTEHPDLFQR